MHFSAWAPFAESVALVAQDRSYPMSRDGDGRWQIELDAKVAREGYRYSIDGRDPVPDPRSRWQPDGVHGSSHCVDVQRLRQSQGAPFKQTPLVDAVMYEMHIGTFTFEGTYAAARARLAHLVSLGVTHIEVMPLASFPGRHGWGYDGVYLFAPLPAYGTPEELVEFIRACHDQGLAVILDVVYNHLGPDGNYLGHYGPYFTDHVKTAWGAALNFDGEHSDAVRDFVVDNALMWLEDYGFDGLRLDAVHAIFSIEAVHVLEEVAAAVHALGVRTGRQRVVIAESDLNAPRLVHAPEAGGYGLDAQWADDFHHAVHRYFTDETAGIHADFNGLKDIATVLRDGFLYQGQYSTFRRRRHGRKPVNVRNDQLVVFAQNHDQVGNRAQGERLSMLLPMPQLKAVAALILLSPFIPLLFQGEEWGAHTPFLYFTDHQDPDVAKMVDEGRRRDFAAFWQGTIPTPQDDSTFSRSKLDWPELAKASHRELLDWYRLLIQVRVSRSAQGGGSRPQVAFDETARWLTFEQQGVLVMLNLAVTAQTVPRPSGLWTLSGRSIVGGDFDEEMAAGETRVFQTARDTVL